jgi:hypothetical protein
MSLASILTKSMQVFGSGAAKNMLAGAGLGLATSAFILTILNQYIDTFANSMNGLQIIGLLAISGVDVAISVIIGALVTRATIASQSISLTKKT